MRTAAALLAVLLLAAAGGTEKKMSTSSYPTNFASPRRDSFEPVASSARGTISWTHELAAPLAGRPYLLMFGERPLVVGGVAFALAGPDGAPVWTQEKRANGPVTVADGRAYYESGAMRLEAVDASGARVLKDAPLPGVGTPTVSVALLWPRESDFVTALSLSDPQYDEENRAKAQVLPVIFGRRASYGAVVSTWGDEYPGRASLKPLFVPERNRWLVGQERVTSVDVESGETSHFAIPVAEPEAWSADAEGTLVFVGRDQKQRKEVTVTSLEGRERWHWVDRDHEDGWVATQPPIRAPRGRVLLLTSQRVIALDNGKLLWQLDLAEEAKRKEQPFEAPRFGTALGDGALLLAAGATLRRINSSGDVTFAVKLPGEIVAPPVVDPAGTIYAVTATQLVQIK